MRRRVKRTLRRYGWWVLGLTVCWSLLWDRVSVPNVVGGVVVAAVLLIAFPLPSLTADDRRLRLRPVALVPLAAEIAKDVVISNVLVTRLTLSPQRQVHTAVIACPLHTRSPRILATVANIAALSPGSMAVEALRDPPTLYVHVLSLDDPASVRRRMAVLERLVVAAVGSRHDRAELERRAADGHPDGTPGARPDGASR